MSSLKIVDPVCPPNYTLQKDRMKYRLCKCIKNEKKSSSREEDSNDYRKVKRRVTVKKPGKIQQMSF